MSAENKREMIELVRQSPQPKRTTIAELGRTLHVLSLAASLSRAGRSGPGGSQAVAIGGVEPAGARGKNCDSGNRARAARSEPTETGLSSHRPCHLHGLRSHRVSRADAVWTESHDLAGGFSC